MTNKILIFLDDERNIGDVTWVDYTKLGVCKETNIVTVRNFEQFKMIVNITNLKNCIISLDHDIQDFQEDGEKTGYDCIKWLVDYFLDTDKDLSELPLVTVHSKNPIGSNNIRSYWLNFIKSI